MSGPFGWAELAGRVITECRVEDHISNDTRTPLRVGLSFADGSTVTLGGAPDGQSLQLGDERLHDHDMGEYGRVEVRRDGPPCDFLEPGACIRAAVPLVDEDDLTVGLRLEANTGLVHIYNWGDELCIERDLPDFVRVALIDL